MIYTLPPAPAAVPAAVYANPFAGLYPARSIEDRPVVRLHRHHHKHFHRHHYKKHGVSKASEAASSRFSHQARSRELVFEVMTGRILYQGRAILDHFESGSGKGMNNPSLQDKPNFGPTPVGLYYLGSPVDKSKQRMGHDAMYLLPARSNIMYGRNDMLMHSREGRTGTHGCIGAPNQAMQDELVAFVKANKIKSVRVVSRLNLKNEPKMQIASADSRQRFTIIPEVQAGSSGANSSLAADMVPTSFDSTISLPPPAPSAFSNFASPAYTLRSQTFRSTVSLFKPGQ